MRGRNRRAVLLPILVVLLAGCILNQGPLATISMNPSSGYAPLLVHFEARSTSKETDLLNYIWDFGDGTSAIGAMVDHEFLGTGEIPVLLTITDAKGRQTTVDESIRLFNRIPHAQFSYQPNPAPTHHPIQFDASDSFDPDGEIVSYHWDFGDGDTASGVVVDHEFQTPSIDYRVVLTVTDDRGDENSMYRELELIGCDH